MSSVNPLLIRSAQSRGSPPDAHSKRIECGTPHLINEYSCSKFSQCHQANVIQSTYTPRECYTLQKQSSVSPVFIQVKSQEKQTSNRI